MDELLLVQEKMESNGMLQALFNLTAKQDDLILMSWTAWNGI